FSFFRLHVAKDKPTAKIAFIRDFPIAHRRKRNNLLAPKFFPLKQLVKADEVYCWTDARDDAAHDVSSVLILGRTEVPTNKRVNLRRHTRARASTGLLVGAKGLHSTALWALTFYW